MEKLEETQKVEIEEENNKMNEEDKKNLIILKNKYNIDLEMAEKIYLSFKKNIVLSIRYIDEEIENINTIHSQTGLSLEQSRILYYQNNKDVVDSITEFLENGFKEKENIDDEIEDNKENILVKETESSIILNPKKNYKHIIEMGKDLLYDEESGYLFDAETKEYFGMMQSAIHKISQLRNIVDVKDTIMKSNKKNIKKEKVHDFIKDYKKKLIEWKEEKLNKWENDRKLRNEYDNDKEKYSNKLDEDIKITFTDQINKYNSGYLET